MEAARLWNRRGCINAQRERVLLKERPGMGGNGKAKNQRRSKRSVGNVLGQLGHEMHLHWDRAKDYHINRV